MWKSLCLQRGDEVTLMLLGSGCFATVSLDKNDFFFHWALLSFSVFWIFICDLHVYFESCFHFSYFLTIYAKCAEHFLY